MKYAHCVARPDSVDDYAVIPIRARAPVQALKEPKLAAKSPRSIAANSRYEQVAFII